MAATESAQSPEAFAGRLGAAALQCRTYGHSWRPRTATHDKRGKVYDVVLVCRCRTERHLVIDTTGSVVSNSYNYPDGYLASSVLRGSGLSRDVFRLESVQRFTHEIERRAS